MTSMTRHGISYTMTLAVVGTILMISGVLVTGQQQQSDVEFCEQRVSDFCRDQSAGTSWTTRFPDCSDYADQIDPDGDGACPLGE